MPCSDHAILFKATAQQGRLSTARLCCDLEKNGMVGAWHGKCESGMEALCKSTLSGMALQGNGMGTACYL